MPFRNWIRRTNPRPQSSSHVVFVPLRIDEAATAYWGDGFCKANQNSSAGLNAQTRARRVPSPPPKAIRRQELSAEKRRRRHAAEVNSRAKKIGLVSRPVPIKNCSPISYCGSFFSPRRRGRAPCPSNPLRWR